MTKREAVIDLRQDGHKELVGRQCKKKYKIIMEQRRRNAGSAKREKRQTHVERGSLAHGTYQQYRALSHDVGVGREEANGRDERR